MHSLAVAVVPARRYAGVRAAGNKLPTVTGTIVSIGSVEGVLNRRDSGYYMAARPAEASPPSHN